MIGLFSIDVVEEGPVFKDKDSNRYLSNGAVRYTSDDGVLIVPNNFWIYVNRRKYA
jgi:hypothetical protein